MRERFTPVLFLLLSRNSHPTDVRRMPPDSTWNQTWSGVIIVQTMRAAVRSHGSSDSLLGIRT